jgi:hypothetical protein
MNNKEWRLGDTALLVVIGLVSLFIWLRQKFVGGKPTGKRATVPSDDLEASLQAAEREQPKQEMPYGPTISLLVDRCVGPRVQVTPLGVFGLGGRRGLQPVRRFNACLGAKGFEAGHNKRGKFGTD